VKILVVKLLTGVYIFGRFDEPMPGDLSRRLLALRLWPSCKRWRSRR
jgi:hypothetical protein